MSVEPDGVFLPQTLGGVETGSYKTYDIPIQKPSKELPQDLRPVCKLTGSNAAYDEKI